MSQTWDFPKLKLKCYDRHSVDQSMLVSDTHLGSKPYFSSCHTVAGVLIWGDPATRVWACSLQLLLLLLVSKINLGSTSHSIYDDILLSQVFRHCISTGPKLESKSKSCYDRRPVSQSVLLSDKYLGAITIFVLLSDSQVHSVDFNFFRNKLLGVSDNVEPQLCLLRTFVESNFPLGSEVSTKVVMVSFLDAISQYFDIRHTLRRKNRLHLLCRRMNWAWNRPETSMKKVTCFFQRTAKHCIPGNITLHSFPYVRHFRIRNPPMWNSSAYYKSSMLFLRVFHENIVKYLLQWRTAEIEKQQVL
jgi:hypothetical protein